MNKNESKYFRTVEKMNKALLEILEKKEFAYVTVKELCEKAGVNRSTFYLHYETLEDLLTQSVEYMNGQFQAHMQQNGADFLANIRTSPLSELYLLTPKYLTPYLDYVCQHRRLFLAATKNAKALRLEESYDRLFRGVFVPILERHQVPEHMADYVMRFYIDGLMAILTQWLRNDCRESTQQIIQIIQRCIAPHQV